MTIEVSVGWWLIIQSLLALFVGGLIGYWGTERGWSIWRSVVTFIGVWFCYTIIYRLTT